MEEQIKWQVFGAAVRGFFVLRGLHGRQADEWTDEVVAIAKEHGLRPTDG